MNDDLSFEKDIESGIALAEQKLSQKRNILLFGLFIFIFAMGGLGVILRQSGYERIYFTSDRSGKVEVYYLDEHARAVQVTNSPGNSISWGAMEENNGRVYFTSDRSGRNEIWYIDAIAHKAVRVTYSPGNSSSWGAMQGAGGRIYFTSDRSGKPELYYLSERLSQAVRVTYSSGNSESWNLFPPK